MRRFAVLVIVAAVCGCRSVDKQKVMILQDEVATLTSLALLNPDLTSGQRARISKVGNAAVAHIDEVSR